MKLNDFLYSLSDIIFPDELYCMCCGDILARGDMHGLCRDCVSKITWLNEDPFKTGDDPFCFDAVFSLSLYDFLTQRIIHDLKFHNKSFYAKPMGRLMGELYNARLGDKDAIFVPVPMHPAKLRSRGYNQAALLAENAAFYADCKYLGDALLKIKQTPSMRMARAGGRRTALEDSIVVNPRRASFLKDKRIVLVDDVVTTGTTANSCASVLSDSGAYSVIILSFSAAIYKGNI